MSEKFHRICKQNHSRLYFFASKSDKNNKNIPKYAAKHAIWRNDSIVNKGIIRTFAKILRSEQSYLIPE